MCSIKYTLESRNMWWTASTSKKWNSIMCIFLYPALKSAENKKRRKSFVYRNSVSADSIPLQKQ